MSIEPYAVRTICIRPVLPPKVNRILPQPTLSMADEARQVRAQFSQTWGNLNSRASGEDANARRKQIAEARRDELAARALELLSEREMTSGEMRDLCHASENQMRNALGWLRAKGLADFTRKRSATVWRLQGGAQ